MRQAKTLSGFRDILPDIAYTKENMLNRRRMFFNLWFVPIETPHLEYAEVLVVKEAKRYKKSGIGLKITVKEM